MYHEDSVTKTHDGGHKDMRHDRKTVWIYPNEMNCNRCPFRLIDKYLTLCPPYYKKPNFYLKSLMKTVPTQWYSEQVVGQNTISKVVQTLMKEAEIPGFFTNHSARCTGGTRLFRAGVDRKLVKEATGYFSDAVDKYQITSDDQRQMMSRIIAGNQTHVSDGGSKIETVTVSEKKVRVDEDICQNGIRNGDISSVVNDVIEKNSSKGKKTIKVSIEITKE